MKLWISGAIAAMLALALVSLPGGGVSTAEALPPVENVCGNDEVEVPDSQPGLFDFTEACQGHDDCYADGGTERDRRNCDKQFLEDMIDSCKDDWRRDIGTRRACSGVARIYYLGVSLGGWAFFPYGDHDL